jgi:hypothetical protein
MSPDAKIKAITDALYKNRCQLDEEVVNLQELATASQERGDADTAARLIVARKAVLHAREDLAFAIGRARGLW